MSSSPHIHYLRRREIDAVKWDACIGAATNGLIYGRSFYLDHMTAGQWDALVLDDYRAVMPLTWKKKWGIRYLYQPPFTQQLGIFAGPTASSFLPGPLPVSPISPFPPSLTESFLFHLDKHFRFAEIFLNYQNALPSLPTRSNFILDLDRPYSEISGQYKKDLVRNLRLAERQPIRYGADMDLQTALRLHKDSYGERIPHVKKEDYARFEKLCFYLQQQGQLLLRSVTGREGQLLAIALLPREKERIYLLQSTTLPDGRNGAANHFLLDQLIREFAGRPMILDLEGSTIPGIAHFYQNFGSHDQPYYFYRHNALPWPLRLLK